MIEMMIEKKRAGYLAKEACDHAWEDRGGLGWIRGGEIITLIIDGVEVGDFDVFIESTQAFSVREVKKERDND